MFGISTFFRKLLIVFYCSAHHVSCESTPVFVDYWPIFRNEGQLLLGKRCRFRAYRTRQMLAVSNPHALLSFGDRCYIGDGVNICAAQKIVIGSHTRLAPNVSIYDTNFHPIQEGEAVFQAGVTIGKNVWIGENAMVMPGVTIGDHTIIGANAVVTRDIPAKVIALGAPARVIKTIQCSDDWVRP